MISTKKIRKEKSSNTPENCVLLGYYAASSGNSLATFWGQLLCPSRILSLEDGTDMLSRNFGKEFPYHCELRNNPEQCSSQLLRGGKLNLLKPTDYVMHQQFNIQQMYALPTLCLCVLYLSENRQRLVPLIS